MNLSKVILFTGAGYSANFKGFLSREMWSWIFNNPKLNDAGRIKQKLREKFDFEEIYSDVFDDRKLFPEHEVRIFKEIVNEAYISMDKVIQSSWDGLNIHHGKITNFLQRIVAPSADGTGVCFTLNQDLIMEKWFGWRPLGPTTMNYEGNWGEIGNTDLNIYSDKILPTKEELDEYTHSIEHMHACYIKLHGSMRWVSPIGDDYKVIGINKLNTIAKIPLLNWYFELFKQAVFIENAKMVIIGYGFRDYHINQLLAQACENNGLKLYIISPQSPVSFQENLLYRNQGTIRSADALGIKIWRGIEGYFPYKLSDLFSKHQRDAEPELETIYNALEI